MTRYLAIFAVFTGFLLPVSAFAQNNNGAGDIFTVAQVPVEATAASAERARLIAQDRGRARAFQILMQRLTPSEDWPYLPRPQLNDLLDMQVGFEVANERFSTNAGQENLYLANITYTFRRENVRPLLRREGIAFSESQAAPALVLAVMEYGGELYLWEPENAWGNVWADTDLSHELVPMIMPRGDLADMTTVPVEDVMAGDWNALSFLANRYNVSSIYLARGAIQNDGENDSLYATLTEITANGAGQTRSVRASGVIRLDDATGMLDLSVLGTRAITILTGRIQANWKTQTLVSYDVQHRIQATAFFQDMEDWVLIRQAFDQSATVTEYDAHALSANGAEVAVNFVGTSDQLAITLDQHGIALTGHRGYWDIRRRGAQFDNVDLNGSGQSYSSTMPPVETIQVREQVQQNAPILSGEDLNILFESPLTPEEIEERRRQGLGDRPGTMQPVDR